MSYQTIRTIARDHLRLCALVFLYLTLLATGEEVNAAPFNSGSTGSDGAFASTSSMTLTMPASGIFNFTTVNIPAGVTVSFVPNVTNTPITMLASGDVTINGTININGNDGVSVNSTVNLGYFVPGGGGGPGGYSGGGGGVAPAFNNGVQINAGSGLGPGGGGFDPVVGVGFGGTYNYGNPNLLPLLGGSGAGGGASYKGLDFNCGTNGCNGGGGGGGGGAILIASSGTIAMNGIITANGGGGGLGFHTPYGGSDYVGAGGGSGGAIRLMANNLTGTGTFSVNGGSGSGSQQYFAPSGPGRIRLEANTFSFTGSIVANPPAGSTSGGHLASVGIPGIVSFTSVPVLAITSVGGTTAPINPTGSLITPDITLPSSITNPISVTVSASNIPVGTVISVSAIPQNGNNGTGGSTTLGGTLSSSNGTASLSLTAGSPYTVMAQATFSATLASNDFPTYAEGEKVEKIRVAANYGGLSTITLITATGKEIQLEKALQSIR